MSKCYLWDRCKTEHEKANPLATGKLYFLGKLFKAPVCGHCVIRLGQLTTPTPTDSSITEMERFRAQHPEYAAVVDKLGKDKVRFELTCNILEANPDDYKEIKTGAPTEFGKAGERVGNPPETPKKPIVTVS